MIKGGGTVCVIASLLLVCFQIKDISVVLDGPVMPDGEGASFDANSS
jgi:hypothetical protein